MLQMYKRKFSDLHVQVACLGLWKAYYNKDFYFSKSFINTVIAIFIFHVQQEHAWSYWKANKSGYFFLFHITCEAKLFWVMMLVISGPYQELPQVGQLRDFWCSVGQNFKQHQDKMTILSVHQTDKPNHNQPLLPDASKCYILLSRSTWH